MDLPEVSLDTNPALAQYLETLIDSNDPFEIVAQIEEELGMPLVALLHQLNTSQ